MDKITNIAIEWKTARLFPIVCRTQSSPIAEYQRPIDEDCVYAPLTVDAAD